VSLNIYEVSMFSVYIASANKQNKGILTGFHKFINMSFMLIGTVFYIFISDFLPISIIALVPAVILIISVSYLILNRKKFYETS
ncbi:MAG: hypothetical protein ABIA04_01595, partial [Pseudomonadota bacterium]